MKSIEKRLAALEKDVRWLKKVIDNSRLLKDTGKGMTITEFSRKGGQAKGKKGLAAMSPEERERVRALALEARRAKSRTEGRTK